VVDVTAHHHMLDAEHEQVIAREDGRVAAPERVIVTAQAVAAS